MKAKRVSEITIVQIAATTLDVVALPTASAPPWALRPLLQAMSVTIQPKYKRLDSALEERHRVDAVAKPHHVVRERNIAEEIRNEEIM